jgi:pseudouridine-5'-monophosphatase
MLPRRPIRAVIFDLDGVLLDTEPLYTQATQAIVGEYGAVFDWSVKADMIGRSDIEGARYMVQTLGIPLEPEQYLIRRKPLLDALFPTTPEMPGARGFVESLRQHQVPLAVATSSKLEQYQLKVSRHGWFESFRVVVCGDDPRVQRAKPNPDIFLVAAGDLGVDPESCVVFEDSLAGVDAATRAGMQVVALPDPAVDAERFSHAHATIRSFGEITPSDLGFG